MRFIMNMELTPKILNECLEKIQNLLKVISLEKLQIRLKEIDNTISSPAFWNSEFNSATIMKERQNISDLLEKMSHFKSKVEFYLDFCSTFETEALDLSPEINSLYEEIVAFEFKRMLNDPLDDGPAILTINAGAGGLEAANWTNMLLRMYLRYAEIHNLKAEILDFHPSEEHSSICLDSVSIRLDGKFAYGFLKGESGVHRLIRNSPFNAADARHTSFAAVSVYPDIEDKINIKIEEKDLEITTMRASGSGGQSVNKISSAVRMKHIPTGIIVNSRGSSSQHDNRKFALKMLRSKLYELEKKNKDSLKDKIHSEKNNISFGHQIITTTLSPFTLMKDHRSGYETPNTESILNGNIHDRIIAALRHTSFIK